MVSDGETASPSRRSSRKKAHVSYDENVIKILEEEEVEKPKRKRAPPKKRHRQAADDEAESNEVEVSGKPSKKRKAASKDKGRGPASERTCPHCDQVCSSKTGLKYHVGKRRKRKQNGFEHCHCLFLLTPSTPPLVIDYVQITMYAVQNSTQKSLPRKAGGRSALLLTTNTKQRLRLVLLPNPRPGAERRAGVERRASTRKTEDHSRLEPVLIANESLPVSWDKTTTSRTRCAHPRSQAKPTFHSRRWDQDPSSRRPLVLWR